MRKLLYKAPSVLKTVDVLLEADLLTGSVMTQKNRIETTNQQVEKHDFTESGFNSTWE